MISKDLVLEAIRQAGVDGIMSTDLYKVLQASTVQQQHEVRNRIYYLRHHDLISVPDKGHYVVAAMFRHYMSVTAYCDSAGKTPNANFYALTFKDDDEDIEDELWNAIIAQTQDHCGNWKEDIGYAVTETAEGIAVDNTYPEIEVGRL